MPADVALRFSRAEYAQRLAQTRAAMEAAGVEILFCADPSNMAWLTGYDGWSFYVHQGVIIGPEGDPVFWGRGMDAKGALRTTYMAAENIVAYPDDFVMAEGRHAMTDLARLLRERGWGGKTLGVEMENYYYTARAHAVLTDAWDGAIVDATALVNWRRAVKSETELGYMRRAARIVERMHARIREDFREGLRKNELVAEILKTSILGAEDEKGPYGGDYAAIMPLLPSGKDASAAHLTWDDKPLERGAGTFFEITGCYLRYHAPLCRTAYIGEPPKEMRVAEAAVIEGLEAGVDAARPGATAGDVARALYDTLEKHGVTKDGRCGYPIGLSYPPDWGERTFSLRRNDETVLQPNMTFHFMPAIWTEDWGVEITEPMRVCADGPAERLGDVPPEIVVKP